MVAYSFKPRFAPLIKGGKKHQTIRAHRKRHARPGEAVQLYTGMRTRHCRKILPDPVCISVENIRILPFDENGRPKVWLKGKWRAISTEFAQADGFEGVIDMVDFWLENHGRAEFSGVLIKWKGAKR